MKVVISVIGKDSVGIIAKVSAVCSECGVNIADITQSVLQDMFVMVMMAEFGDGSSTLTDFSDRLAALAAALGVDIRVMRKDIFDSMHRI